MRATIIIRVNREIARIRVLKNPSKIFSISHTHFSCLLTFEILGKRGSIAARRQDFSRGGRGWNSLVELRDGGRATGNENKRDTVIYKWKLDS